VVSAVRRLPALLVPLALAAVLAGCGGGEGGGNGGAEATPVAGVTEVAAKDNQFTPPAIEVPPGTTVTWAFEDRFVPRDVTGEGWSSGDPRRGGSFTHNFARPGSYPYRCTIHDGMDGRVVVVAGT
jgi:plastocyanin